MNTKSDAPIRIALAITELEPGGAERCLVELATRLDRRRFAPTVYCLGPRPTGNPTLAERLEQSGVVVRYFGARSAVQFPPLVVKLRRQLRADAPAIVQSFLFHANFAATLAARGAGVPNVVTGIRVAERRPRGHLLLARLVDRWVERHVCVSQAVREFSSRQGRLPENKLVVIPNGVDVERFAAAAPCPLQSLGVVPLRRVIVYVGRLDEQKGLAWLLEQMPRVFAQSPDHDWVLVGVGPERERLGQMAARLGILDRVHFAGFRGDVAQILAASDLLVLPSRWEGMPNVILEAMAAGKPVVATDVEGVRELLGQQAAAQMVGPTEPAAFAEKMATLLADPALAADLGRKNQARAGEHFSLSGMVSAYEKLYESLMEPSKTL